MPLPRKHQISRSFILNWFSSGEQQRHAEAERGYAAAQDYDVGGRETRLAHVAPEQPHESPEASGGEDSYSEFVFLHHISPLIQS